jgi:hypothetical protein
LESQGLRASRRAIKKDMAAYIHVSL